MIKFIYIMKNFYSNLKTLALLIVALVLLFLGITAYSTSLFINMMFIIGGIFVLFLVCDLFDKNNHLGKYTDK